MLWIGPVALAILSSINTLWNGFATDDNQQILNNTFIKSLSNLPLAFTASVWSFTTQDIAFVADSYYRPMFMALFTINYASFGASAWGWHLVNVLIHAAVTLLLFVVLKEATSRARLAAIAAALFAVHPVHAESISWISGVTDPMAALFMLPSFYFYLRYRRSGKKLLIGVALILYLFALLSKETALALPLIVAYWELAHSKQPATLRERIIRLMPLAGMFTVPTVIYFLMRYAALSSVLFGSGARYPLISALLTAPLATAKYLLFMLVPAGYSYQHYTDFITRAWSIEFIGPLVLIVAITIAIFFSKSRMLAFASFWFIITLAPVLAAIRQFDPEFLVQERYLYLPSMGFCLAIGIGIERLSEARLFAARNRRAALTLTAVIVIVWGAAYIRHSRTWQDSISVFENCVAVDPQSALARTYLARTYFDAGRLKQAEEHIQMALNLDPQCPAVYYTASYLSHRRGMLDKSIEYLERAIEKIPEGPMTRNNLATIYLNLGLLYQERKDLRLAEDSILKSLAIWPRAVGYYYAGQFYFDQGRYEESLAMLELARQIIPRSYALIYLRLGQVHEKLNQPTQARTAYEKYIELAPHTEKDREEVLRRLRQL